MNEQAWVALLDHATTPSGIIAVVLVLIFGPPAILSETAAKRLGGLGVLARWWKERKRRAVEVDRAARASEIEDLRREVARLSERLDRLRDEVVATQRSEADQHAYIVFVTGQWRKLEVWAAEGGHNLPLVLPSYAEWLAKRRRQV